MIAELIDCELVDERLTKNQDWGPKKKFYASDLGRCKRALYYDFKPGTPKKPPQAKSIRRMAIGEMLQAYHEKYLKDLGLLISSEAYIPNGTLGGRRDWIIKNPILPDEEKVTVEVKTLNQQDADGLLKALDEIEWVREHKKNYLHQILYYLMETKQQKGLLHFIGLNGVALDVEVNIDELADEVAAVTKEIESYASLALSEDPPQREYKLKKDWQCNYCDYAEHCWQGYTPAENEMPTESEAKLIADFIVLKDHESEIKKKLDDVKEKLEIVLFKKQVSELVGPIGGVKFQVKKSVEYDEEMLQELLEPEVFSELLEVSDSKLKALIKQKKIKEADLEPARTVSYSRSLVQIKGGNCNV